MADHVPQGEIKVGRAYLHRNGLFVRVVVAIVDRDIHYRDGHYRGVCLRSVFARTVVADVTEALRGQT